MGAYTKLRSSVYQKKLKSLGNFAPRTLTTFGFALTHWTDARRWTLTALRSGLDVFSMVKRLKSGHDLFVSAQFAPDLLRGRTPWQLRCYLRMALRRPPSKCWATAAGAERLVARVCARGQILRGLGGPGEVTSPLFSINSILNANWYETVFCASPGQIHRAKNLSSGLFYRQAYN